MTGKVSQVDIALLSSWLSPTGVPRLAIHHHPVTARLHAPNCLTAVPFGIPDMLSPNRVHPMLPAFTLSGSAQSGTTGPLHIAIARAHITHPAMLVWVKVMLALVGLGNWVFTSAHSEKQHQNSTCSANFDEIGPVYLE